MHPLSGADIATLFRLFRRHGGGTPQGRQLLLSVWGAALARAPFTLAEQLWCAAALPALRDVPPPVFIVGHWRSGTTHLYQLLVEAGFGYVPPAATGLPWDFLLLAKMLERRINAQLPAHRYIDRVPVKPDSPQEDEVALANMSTLSLYHGLYFPRRLAEEVRRGVFFEGATIAEVDRWQRRLALLLRKLSYAQDRRRLLIKNPPHTARVGMLARMLPGAKFIHIHRNPVEVVRSMRNFYAKLLAAFALQPYDTDEIDPLIFEVYDRMMAAVTRDSAELSPDRFHTVAFEDFTADPLNTVERMWRALDLGAHGVGAFEIHRPRFETYLDSQRNFEINRFDDDPADTAMIEARLAPWFERLGYLPSRTRPAPAGPSVSHGSS